MKNYGEILKEHRIANGIKLLEIEKATGISNQNLSRWERGKVIPSIAFCEQLADFYDITLDELVGRDDKQKNNIEKITFREIKAARSNDNKTTMKSEILTKEEAERRRKALDDAADKDE